MTTTEETIAELEEHIESKNISLAEAVTKYDVVSANYDPVNGSYVILADRRDPGISRDVGIAELGYTSLSPWTAWTRDERVPELRDKIGLRTFYDMKRADGTVRGALRLIKTSVLAGRWFVEPKSESAIDKNIADFVEDNLFNKMNLPWSRVLEDALLMCEYGYFPMEKVYTQSEDGKLRLQKLGPRHPLDIRQWIYDANGGPKTIIMEPTEASGWQEIDIPIEKLVVFVLEQEGGDMRGISLLRSAYQHYYYKSTLYKIDAIQKERHGIGVPYVKLPLGFSADDKRVAEDLARNLRTNERAHIVAPENWDIGFAELRGQPVDCMTSIAHHNDQIMINILAPFYKDGGAKEDSMSMFFKSTRYIAKTITDAFNHFVIPQLVDFNFIRGGYPKLCARRIGEIDDLRTLSFAVRNFVGAGIVTPDEELETFIRNEADLPPADKGTRRVINAPAGSSQEQPKPNSPHYEPPGTPGAPAPSPAQLPRQAPSPPVGVGKPNTGRDTSGGN